MTAIQASEGGGGGIYRDFVYVTKSNPFMFNVSMQDNDKFPSNSVVNCCTDVAFSVLKFQQLYSCTNV